MFSASRWVMPVLCGMAVGCTTLSTTHRKVENPAVLAVRTVYNDSEMKITSRNVSLPSDSEQPGVPVGMNLATLVEAVCKGGEQAAGTATRHTGPATLILTCNDRRIVALSNSSPLGFRFIDGQTSLQYNVIFYDRVPLQVTSCASDLKACNAEIEE